MKLECDCGSKKFVEETNYQKKILNSDGQVIDRTLVDTEILYFCFECGEEITPTTL